MRKQAAQLCLRVLIAILCLPGRGDIYLEMGRPLAGNLLLALEITKGGTNALRSKKTALGWSFKLLLGYTI